MLRFLGILFLLGLGSATVLAVDYFSESLWLDEFMEKQSLLLMGTMLSIYLVISSSFLAILSTHEKEKEKVMFRGTASELKQNFIFVIVVFVTHFLLLSATPPSSTDNAMGLRILMFCKVLTFSLYIYAIYELSSVLFGLRDTLNSDRTRP